MDGDDGVFIQMADVEQAIARLVPRLVVTLVLILVVKRSMGSQQTYSHVVAPHLVYSADLAFTITTLAPLVVTSRSHPRDPITYCHNSYE